MLRLYSIMTEFTNSKDFLGKIVKVEIDRPLGSKHPKWELFYSVNYGFVPKTKSSDGGELDVYLLGIFDPVKKFTGRCIAITHRTNDDDDKLIIVPKERAIQMIK